MKLTSHIELFFAQNTFTSRIEFAVRLELRPQVVLHLLQVIIKPTSRTEFSVDYNKNPQVVSNYSCMYALITPTSHTKMAVD